MLTVSDYRERYGPVYVVEVCDDFLVPFRLLSISEYFDYVRSINMGLIVESVIENEIFCKCVLDPVLVDNIDKHKAGVVSSVAKTIMQHSAVANIDQLNELLYLSRAVVNEHILHQLTSTICLAFPSYTPDDIYNMDIDKFMLRFALAERKLLDTGIIKEPYVFDTQKQKPVRAKLKVDPDKLKQYYEQQGIQDSRVEQASIQEHKIDKDGDIIISGQDIIHDLNTNPTADTPIEKQMIEEARRIYAPYLEDLKKGKKVKIKSHEEQVVEAEARAEANRKKAIQKKRKG